MAVVTISATTIAENSTGEIATLECEGAVSYRLIASPNILEIFEVVGDKIVVKQGAILDYEIRAGFSFEIEALDSNNEAVGLLSFTEENPFRISNLNDNTPDTIRLDGELSLDIPESTQAGSVIGTLSASDADWDPIVGYALDGENSFFEIVNDDGIFKVQLKHGVDYEAVAQRKHTLRITAKDELNTSSVQEITINVTNVNDNAPTGIVLSATSISESAQVGDIIGELSATDADGDLIEYSLAENNFFEIDRSDGKWVIRLKASVDHENVDQREHTLKVTATDGDNTSEIQSITINVIDENDNAPSDITLNGGTSLDISESTQAGSYIGELSATDADGDVIVEYALIGESDFFAIENDNGTWKVRLKQSVDYEAVSQREHTLKIIAKDGLNTSLEQDITINVTNVNDNAPVNISLDGKISAEVVESADIGSVIGVLSATDADGNAITGYALVEQNTTPYEVIEIDGHWVVRLKAGLDYETQRQHVLKVTATDGTRTSLVQDITINVTNVNDNAPTGIVLSNTSISESAKPGDVVGVLSATDADGDSVTGYALAEPNAFFDLVYENGAWLIKLKAGVDYENAGQREHVLKITVTDGTRTSTVQNITIKVTNANEGPTDILVNGGTIGDNAIIGATVATLAGQDPDRGDQLTYTIVDDETGTVEYNHPYFGISGNEIVVKSDLGNAPIGVDLPVYVKVTDANGLFYVKELTFNVEYVNKAPTISSELMEVLNGAKGGSVVAVLKAQDVDSSQLTFKLSKTSSTWFHLVDNQDGTYDVVVNDGFTLELGLAAFESFVVEVSDNNNNTTTETVFLNINENLEPEATFEFLEVEKNTPGGTLVGKLVGYDPEGQAVDYTLSGDSIGLFTLVKNVDGTYGVFVKQGVTLDHLDEAQRSFTVMVSDRFNPPFEETFDLVFGSFAPRVTDAPPISVKEGEGGNTVVAKFKVTDPDYDDVVDCSLSPESEVLFDLEDLGNGNYNVVVREGVRLDYENPAHRNVRVIVSDGSNTLTRDFTVNITDEIDVITGTAKTDSLTGTAGRDIIKGLAANDSLVGDTGDDTLYGGAGKDVLNGGAGQDVFVFDSKPNKKTNLDKVADFKVVDDSIWLENKIFTKLGKKGTETKPAQLSKKFFALENAKDQDDYIVYSKKTGKLYFDIDGSGSKAAVEIATLSKKLAMTYKDFFVV